MFFDKLFRETSDVRKSTRHPMRLLSFLTEIERAVMMEANAAEGSIWDATRMVNFQAGLARLTLTLRADAEPGMPEGTLIVQHFGLADGSFCVKANLQWTNSTVPTVLSVYETPALNWKMEVSRIASTWLAGAPAVAETAPTTGSVSAMERLAATGTG